MQRDHQDRVQKKRIAREEAVDSRVLEGANFPRDQVGVRLVRKPALRRRLLRLISLMVISLVAIGLWIAAICTAFAPCWARERSSTTGHSVAVSATKGERADPSRRPKLTEPLRPAHTAPEPAFEVEDFP